MQCNNYTMTYIIITTHIFYRAFLMTVIHDFLQGIYSRENNFIKPCQSEERKKHHLVLNSVLKS